MAGNGMKIISEKNPVLGINGLGRIGKLSLWHHIGRKHFSGVVVNIGRKAGTSLQDIAFYIEKDSTYGTLHQYLYGYRSKRLIEKSDEDEVVADGACDRLFLERKSGLLPEPREKRVAIDGQRVSPDEEGERAGDGEG